MSGPKVVPFEREGWRDAAKTLREVADELDGVDIDPCEVGALVMLTSTGVVEVFGFGPRGEDLQCLALFRLGEQRMVDAMLGEEG